jgi:hypothetical protein
MNAQATTLQTAENDLKQLMADVTRAMEKAQEAVARITSEAVAATAETGSTTSSHCAQLMICRYQRLGWREQGIDEEAPA